MLCHEKSFTCRIRMMSDLPRHGRIPKPARKDYGEEVMHAHSSVIVKEHLDSIIIRRGRQ